MGIKDGDSHNACMGIKLCTDVPPKSDNFICDTCEQGMSWAMKMFKNNESAMKNIVLTTCNLLPSDQEEDCKDNIEQKWNEIFKIIKDGDSNAICAAMKMCTDEK